MKKLIIIYAIIIASSILWFGESRSFFCLSNGKCVTVWKTYNDVCYIIPGKYYGIFRPANDFIKTTNSNNLTIYFTDEIPNAFIFRSEQDIEINNDGKNKYVFYDYNQYKEKFDKVLDREYATKNSDVKNDAQLIDIIIYDDFALDKNGRTL
jgi:hypothetical protein